MKNDESTGGSATSLLMLDARRMGVFSYDGFEGIRIGSGSLEKLEKSSFSENLSVVKVSGSGLCPLLCPIPPPPSSPPVCLPSSLFLPVRLLLPLLEPFVAKMQQIMYIEVTMLTRVSAQFIIKKAKIRVFSSFIAFSISPK